MKSILFRSTGPEIKQFCFSSAVSSPKCHVNMRINWLIASTNNTITHHQLKTVAPHQQYSPILDRKFVVHQRLLSHILFHDRWVRRGSELTSSINIDHHIHTLTPCSLLLLFGCDFFSFLFFSSFPPAITFNKLFISDFFFPFFDAHTHTVTEMPRFGGDWGCVQRVSGKTNFPLVFHYLFGICGWWWWFLSCWCGVGVWDWGQTQTKRPLTLICCF